MAAHSIAYRKKSVRVLNLKPVRVRHAYAEHFFVTRFDGYCRNKKVVLVVYPLQADVGYGADNKFCFAHLFPPDVH